MKRLCASVSEAVLFLLAALFCGFFGIGGMINLCRALRVGEAVGWYPLVYLLFVALAVLFLWCANRYGCLVWYEDGAIRRRGLFGGFERTVPVETIRAVETRVFLHTGTFYVLIDDSEKPYGYIYQNSSICFRRTKRSTAFVRSFWDKDMTETTNR